MDVSYQGEYFSKPADDGTWFVQRKHRVVKIIDKLDKGTADKVAWGMNIAHYSLDEERQWAPKPEQTYAGLQRLAEETAENIGRQLPMHQDYERAGQTYYSADEAKVIIAVALRTAVISIATQVALPLDDAKSRVVSAARSIVQQQGASVGIMQKSSCPPVNYAGLTCRYETYKELVAALAALDEASKPKTPAGAACMHGWYSTACPYCKCARQL